MRGLGETIAEFSQRRKTNNPQSSGDADCGLSEVRGFGFNPGDLRMLAGIPSGLVPGAALVVVLHGCTQRAGSHARAAGWLALADRFGFAVLAPEQTSANNANRCFNWFVLGDTARGEGEAASVHAMVQHMIGAYEIDPTRVFVTGLSAGGAMTAALLAAYPETFAAGAVVAGLPVGVARNVQEAFAAMHGHGQIGAVELSSFIDRAAPAPSRKPRLAIWHGQADTTVVSSNAKALARQWSHYLGLAEQPQEVCTDGAWTRSVWRGRDGEAHIEMNLVAGLGHGTPLATRSDDPIGEQAPFMLEAGVSSTLEIARFWGLAPLGSQRGTTTGVAAPAADRRTGLEGLGRSIMASVSPHVSDDVQTVIAKALTSAGLIDGLPRRRRGS